MNSPAERSQNRILIIDDNPSIHQDIRKILTSAEVRNPSLEQAKAAVLGESFVLAQGSTFLIDSATQGEEGWEMVRRAVEIGQPYMLAFVDMRMPPGWDGITTLKRLWETDPNLQIVICTAYSDYPWEDIVRQIGKSANMVILKKPFDNIEVLQLAHALTEKWSLNEQVQVKLSNLDHLVRQRTAEFENANEQLKREMAERVSMEQALRQAQKMEAVGQLAAGVAHDFNNILTIVLGHVSLLDEFAPAPEARESLREIRDSAERASRLVRQLLAFSRKQVIQPLPLDLGEVITKLGAVLRRVLGEHIALQVRPAANLPFIEADLRMIEQVVINLSINARDAMPHGGSLIIATTEVEIVPDAVRRNPEARPGHFVCLSVVDTGVGIAPEIVPHIFEPFFTTKDTGKGTGLGLASVYGIVKQHAGWIEVQTEVSHGSTFRLFFPVCPHGRALRSGSSVSECAAGGNESILVVEDDPSVRRLAVDLLKRAGYRVCEAESGVAALEMFQQGATDIDLVLTDMIMPGGISGRDLAQHLHKHKPSLSIIYMTGYSGNFAGTNVEPFDEFNFLAKPFSGNDLLRNVRQSLNDSQNAKRSAEGP